MSSKKMSKRMSAILAAGLMIVAMPVTASAHRGRTDSSGGHHDYGNVSGLGSYHYHCGGHPAHLHENGVCPYSSYSSSSSVSTTSSSSSSYTKAEWIGNKYWNGSGFAKGWTKIGSKTYYFNSDYIKVTGWGADSDGNKFYFGSDGAMVTGWQKIGDDTYFFSAEGYMRTGWRKIGDDTYYFGNDGKMRTGFRKFGDDTYYFDENGKRQTGWVEINGDMYYFLSNGVMAVGRWKLTDGVTYTFDTNGKLVQSEVA